MKLSKKTILVTGASSGIGREIAIECAREGANVIIHYRKNSSGADDTLKAVHEHSTGISVQADLTVISNVTNLFKKISLQFPQIDMLVNNAGEFTAGDINDYDIWIQQMSCLFYSTLYTSNEFLKQGSKSGIRKILNISSVYSFPEMGIPDGIQYTVAKATVNSLTTAMAKKYAPDVLINAVAPGYTLTRNWDDISEMDKKDAISKTRIKRFIKAEEVATLAVAVLSNDALTGEILRIDGGLHLQDLF